MKKPAFAAVIVAAVLASLPGCATRGEPEFGSSVRHMVTGQTFNPAAPTDTIGGVDGQKAAQAVTTYRAGKDKGAAAPSPMVLMPTQQ